MSFGGGDLDNSQRIEGGTDNTIIGNTGDRLRVEAVLNPTAVTNTLWITDTLKNGVAINMNVNGSVTPVNYTYTPSTDFILTAIVFFLWDNGTTSATNFGGIAALTNGLQLKIRAQGTEYTILNLQNNIDVVNFFPDFPLISPTSGFMETADLYKGILQIFPPMNLSVGSSDYVRMTVRDNLTALDQVRATVQGYRTL